MEKEHSLIIYGPRTVDSKNVALQKTTALVAEETKALEAKVQMNVTGRELIIEVKMATGYQGGNEHDYYIMEELDQSEHETMVYLVGRLNILNLEETLSTKCYN